MLYAIGQEGGTFSIDPLYLVVQFDGRGRVELYDVEQM